MLQGVNKSIPDRWHLPSPSKLRTPVLMGVVVLLLIIGAVTALVLRTAYSHSLEQVETRAEMLSQILVEHTLRNIQTVDLILETVIDRSSGVVADHDPEFQAWMERYIAAMPFVRALYIVGADGFLVHNTRYPTTPRINVADRPCFAFHKNNPGGGLHVGQPLLS